jgi:VanZ family protein
MKKIARDKWKHFFVGIAMGLVLQYLVFLLLPRHPIIGSAVALFAIIIISYAFEIYSIMISKGHYDVIDALASIIGGVIGMVVLILFRNNVLHIA